MIKDEITSVPGRRALNNFDNIKECLQGLYEILEINLPRDSIYFKIGQDNIENLYQNFLELMINDIGTHELMMKIKKADINLDMELANATKNKQ